MFKFMCNDTTVVRPDRGKILIQRHSPVPMCPLNGPDSTTEMFNPVIQWHPLGPSVIVESARTNTKARASTTVLYCGSGSGPPVPPSVPHLTIYIYQQQIRPPFSGLPPGSKLRSDSQFFKKHYPVQSHFQVVRPENRKTENVAELYKVLNGHISARNPSYKTACCRCCCLHLTTFQHQLLLYLPLTRTLSRYLASTSPKAHSMSSKSAKSSKSSTFSRSSSAEQETNTVATGLILSLKLGNKYRKTMNLTFTSDHASTTTGGIPPLFYVQIATNSIKLMNLHANSAFTHEVC